jgi:hypothetical protein
MMLPRRRLGRFPGSNPAHRLPGQPTEWKSVSKMRSYTMQMRTFLTEFRLSISAGNNRPGRSVYQEDGLPSRDTCEAGSRDRLEAGCESRRVKLAVGRGPQPYRRLAIDTMIGQCRASEMTSGVRLADCPLGRNLYGAFSVKRFSLSSGQVFYPFQVSLFGWRAVSLPRPASRK